MKKPIFFYVLLLALLSLSACSTSSPNVYNVIPLPQQMEPKEGKFVLDGKTTITIPAENKDFRMAADFLAQRIELASGIKLSIVEGDRAVVANSMPPKTIWFVQSDRSDFGKEGYTLSVTKDGIKVEAQTGNGAFYAIQTILQLLPPEILSSQKQNVAWTIPCVEVKDAPRYSYRGMHLDAARHFFSVDFIKRYIDMMALHKMNTFHWHLTDDQGWRIEIKSHPKLTEIGSKRKETLVGSYYDEYPQVYDGKPYDGYYTQEDVKAVVEYARQRFITVIPEIEMPGHAMAALSAYPELSCTGAQIEVSPKWGIFPDIFCPKEETFKLLEDVLTEVMGLFPSEYIHLGGDECPKIRWKECKHCQALIKKEKLKNEEELQSYFMSRMEKFVSSHGRRIIGWDEILDGGLPEEATVMSWRGIKGGIAAAQQKHYVIMTPTTHCYLDYYQYDPYFESVTIGNFTPLQKTYSFEPTPEELSHEEQQYILGVQGNMWNEYNATSTDVESDVFPRALAIAEIAWTNKDKKDFYDFARRLKAHFAYLDALGVTYSKTMFDVLVTPEYNAETSHLMVKLQSQYDTTAIRYTTDGSMPNKSSSIYSTPLEINGRVTLKAGLFENGKLIGRIFEREYVGHKALGAVCKVEGDTATTLIPVDGLRASVFENPGWYPKPRNMVRADGADLTLTLDLKQSTPISRVTAGLVNQPLYRVVAPTEIMVAYSDDGQTFTTFPAAKIENKEPNRRRNVEGSTTLSNVTARYLKVTLKNAGSPFPTGSTNEGKPSVILLDELIVE